LPEPFLPTNPTRSPGLIDSVTFSKSTCVPYALERLLIWIIELQTL
jgi:hypothetical protein